MNYCWLHNVAECEICCFSTRSASKKTAPALAKKAWNLALQRVKTRAAVDEARRRNEQQQTQQRESRGG